MLPGFDHRDGNVLVHLDGEEAAVVVFRAVLANQAGFAAMQSALLHGERELVSHPAQRRQIQLGTARLAHAVDQQFHHALLGDGRGVQQRDGRFHGTPAIGIGTSMSTACTATFGFGARLQSTRMIGIGDWRLSGFRISDFGFRISGFARTSVPRLSPLAPSLPTTPAACR